MTSLLYLLINSIWSLLFFLRSIFVELIIYILYFVLPHQLLLFVNVILLIVQLVMKLKLRNSILHEETIEAVLQISTLVGPISYWSVVQHSVKCHFQYEYLQRSNERTICSWFILIQILVGVFLYLERWKGFVSSGVLFVYWAVSIISTSMSMYNKILHHVSTLNEFVCAYIQ